jgi:hypothetical protein
MTTEERFDRIESILERVVDNQGKFDTVLSVLAESHVKTQEAHLKTEESLQSLAAEVARTQQGLQALERQWQAYLTTIRPQ